MSIKAIEKKLREVSSELVRVREELRVLDEQIDHFADSAEEARLRAIVSETPQAQREHGEAARTVAALQRDRTSWQERQLRLEAEQDELLDQLSAAR